MNVYSSLGDKQYLVKCSKVNSVNISFKQNSQKKVGKEVARVIKFDERAAVIGVGCTVVVTITNSNVFTVKLKAGKST